MLHLSLVSLWPDGLASARQYRLIRHKKSIADGRRSFHEI